jgi:hypothetical protein
MVVRNRHWNAASWMPCSSIHIWGRLRQPPSPPLICLVDKLFSWECHFNVFFSFRFTTRQDGVVLNFTLYCDYPIIANEVCHTVLSCVFHSNFKNCYEQRHITLAIGVILSMQEANNITLSVCQINKYHAKWTLSNKQRHKYFRWQRNNLKQEIMRGVGTGWEKWNFQGPRFAHIFYSSKISVNLVTHSFKIIVCLLQGCLSRQREGYTEQICYCAGQLCNLATTANQLPTFSFLLVLFIFKQIYYCTYDKNNT